MHEETDFMITGPESQSLIFKKFNFCIVIEETNSPLLEIVMNINQANHSFRNWADKEKSYISNAYKYREIEPMRLVFEFDLKGTLTSQYGKFFPGLHFTLCYPYDFASLRYRETAEIFEMCKEIKDQDILDAKVKEMLDTKKEIFFQLGGFDMELKPSLLYGSSGVIKVDSYSLTVHKNQIYSLPYATALLTISRKKNQGTSEKFGFNAPAEIQEIVEAKTLQQSISSVSKYLRTTYGITNDQIIDILQRKEAEKILENYPDALDTTFGEYFQSVKKRKKITMKFKAIVLSNMIFNRDNLTNMSSSPKNVLKESMSPKIGPKNKFINKNNKKYPSTTRNKSQLSSTFSDRVKIHMSQSPKKISLNSKFRIGKSYLTKESSIAKEIKRKKTRGTDGDTEMEWLDTNEDAPTSNFSLSHRSFDDKNELFSIEQILDEPTYNIFEYPSNQDKFFHCWEMFHLLGLTKRFSIKEGRFMAFIFETQKLYDKRDNPYHNFDHGVSVLQGAYWLLKKADLGSYYNSIGKLSLLFASLMHDIDHTGVTNMYEVNSMSDIAILYNDKAVLENHHCATAFRLIQDKRCNILWNLNRKRLQILRSIVIKGILATDVTKHFTSLNKFKNKIENKDFQPSFIGNREDFDLLTEIVVHTCDIYSATKNLSVAKKWSQKINEEFSNQNLLEKQNKLPETPFYKNLDVLKVVAKSESFFIDKIVSPLWTEFDHFLKGKLTKQKKNLKVNLNYWKKVYEQEVEKEKPKLKEEEEEEEG